MSPWVGKSMDRKAARRRTSKRQANIDAGYQLCEVCDGTGNGIGGFRDVACMGTGRAAPRTPGSSKGGAG